MNILTLNRYYSDDECTLGVLSIVGQKDPIWYTIEKPWLDNKPEVSCIPRGVYDVKPYSSQKYPDTLEICNVPDRTHILFHTANWANQLQGCIAPGLSAGYIMCDRRLQKAVTNSVQAMYQIKEAMGKEFVLQII